MRRKTDDSGVSRKIITLKNFDLIDGYVKDIKREYKRETDKINVMS